MLNYFICCEAFWNISKNILSFLPIERNTDLNMEDIKVAWIVIVMDSATKITSIIWLYTALVTWALNSRNEHLGAVGYGTF